MPLIGLCIRSLWKKSVTTKSSAREREKKFYWKITCYNFEFEQCVILLLNFWKCYFCVAQTTNNSICVSCRRLNCKWMWAQLSPMMLKCLCCRIRLYVCLHGWAACAWLLLVYKLQTAPSLSVVRLKCMYACVFVCDNIFRFITVEFADQWEAVRNYVVTTVLESHLKNRACNWQ